jgi:hypothetical protein
VLILDLIDVVTSDALAGFDKTVVYEKVLWLVLLSYNWIEGKPWETDSE